MALILLAAAGTAQGTIIFRATLTHDQEVANPPIPDEGSGGVATFVLNDAMTRLRYDVRLFGLDLRGVNAAGVPGQPILGESGPPETNDNLTRLHIHRNISGFNGNIVFGMIDANPLLRNDLDALVIDVAGRHITGDWDLTEGSQVVNQVTNLANELSNLLSAGLYINVHTQDHGGGEIRGQILQVVPEPGALALFGIGSLSLIGFALRRRRPD
jgi:hypothetical protein